MKEHMLQGGVRMLMPDMTDDAMLAPCGVNCVACLAHVRTKNSCAGCLGPDAHKRKSCLNCVRKNCAAGKGLTWCFQCGDFPCEHIKTLDRSYRRRYGINLVGNGLFARKNGVAALLMRDRAYFTCACGGIICEHDGICSECGKKTERVSDEN